MTTSPASTSVRRAAIYVRISQDRGGAGLGVTRQERDARTLCKRLGWEVGAVYADNDLSAYRGKRRPGYLALLAALADGTVEAVVAWHPDRLHRSPRELEDFIDAIERVHAEVATVTAGDLDLATPAGRMTARIHGAVARHESEHKAERIRRKHVELAETGQVPGGGRRPFGYESDRVTVREDEAELIRDAAARILAGQSLRSIVTEWSERGVRTVTGAQWSTTTVKRLLMSGRISGQREHLGRIASDAVWPAIIRPEQTIRLRALLTDQRRSRPAGVSARKYLLTGLLYCGRCGERMTTRPSHNRGHRYERYVCATDRGGCGRCGISTPQLDELVTEAVLLALDKPKLAQAVERKRKQAAKASPVDEIADVEQRRLEAAEMFARREITISEWQAVRKVLEDDLRRLGQEVVEQTAAAVVLPDVEDLRERWADLDLDRRRSILVAIIERVEIAPTTRAGNKFNGDRVNLVWKV